MSPVPQVKSSPYARPYRRPRAVHAKGGIWSERAWRRLAVAALRALPERDRLLVAELCSYRFTAQELRS